MIMSRPVNRRTFLRRTASAFAAGTFIETVPDALAAGATLIPGGIIDTHVHFYDPTRPQGVPWPPKNDALLYKTTLPDRYRDVTRGLGVAGVIVVEASVWLEDNQWLLDLAAKEPTILGIVGNLEVGTPLFKDHLARFARNPLFRGIRIGAKALSEGVNKADFMGDLKRLADADREVDFVGGPAMLPDVVRVAEKIPALRIVIDHFPFAVAEKDREQTLLGLREFGKRTHVFAKVSNVLRRVGDRVPEDMSYYKPALDELWEDFGPDRLVYGSNWPVSERVAPYPLVQKIVGEYFATKGQEALERYFRRNSIAAYRWEKRETR